jgi:hypothetical protein
MFIPDPGVKEAPDPGSGSATLFWKQLFPFIFLVTFVHVGLTLMSVCQRALSQFQADWTAARSQQVNVLEFLNNLWGLGTK